MRTEYEKALADRFDFMKARNVWTGELLLNSKGNYCGFPCECDDGWYDLITNLCQDLTDFYKSKGADTTDIRLLQVKEKFGGLRFYVGNVIQGTFELVDKYERESYNICEVCGEVGTLSIKNGWYRTLCGAHRDEYGYRIIEG